MRQGLLRDGLHRDLAKFDVSTLVLHGEDDQIVPVRDSLMKSARLTHINDRGEARMVDISAKGVTSREAKARGAVRMTRAALDAIGSPPIVSKAPPI